jgi:hypothetical protein
MSAAVAALAVVLVGGAAPAASAAASSSSAPAAPTTGTVLEAHSEGSPELHLLQVAGLLYDTPTAAQYEGGAVVAVRRTAAGYDAVREVRSADLRAGAAAEPVTAHHVVAVLYTSGGAAPDTTAAAVAARVAAVGDYYRHETAGAVDLVLDRTVSVSGSVGCSSFSGLMNDAARKAGFTPGPGRHLAVFLGAAALRSCAPGMGTIGSGRDSGGFLYVGGTLWNVLAHELGHNLGLHHATTLAGCSTPDPVGTGALMGCRRSEYGDVLDVMGASGPNVGQGHLNVLEREQLGLSPAPDAVTGPGTSDVSLAATDAALRGGLPDGAVLGTRVTDLGGTSYWVEYRPATGLDGVLAAVSPQYRAGVRILKTDPTGGGSQWIDPSPADRSGVLDAVLKSGDTWTSNSGHTRITVTATTDDAAALHLELSRTSFASLPRAGGGQGLQLLAYTSDATAEVGKSYAVNGVLLTGSDVAVSGATVALMSVPTDPAAAAVLLKSGKTGRSGAVSFSVKADSTPQQLQLVAQPSATLPSGVESNTIRVALSFPVAVVKVTKPVLGATATVTVRSPSPENGQFTLQSHPLDAAGRPMSSSWTDVTSDVTVTNASKGELTLPLPVPTLVGYDELRVVRSATTDFLATTSKTVKVRVYAR